MVKIIALSNLKGGTGKTNVAVNLSMFLSALGKRVLLIDMTPQGDATFSLGIKSSPNYVGDVLLQKIRPKLAIKSTPYFSFDIMPSFPELISLIGKMRELRKPEMRLKEAIDKIDDDYDFILIDTCPDLNYFTLNALYAADEIMIPIQSEVLLEAFQNGGSIVPVSGHNCLKRWKIVLKTAPCHPALRTILSVQSSSRPVRRKCPGDGDSD